MFPPIRGWIQCCLDSSVITVTGLWFESG